MKLRLPHISQLRIANFRPFGAMQVIPLRPITLIYGPNSAGKSSILKALRWISSLKTPESINDFCVHVHDRDLERQIQFAVLLPSSKFIYHCRDYPELKKAFSAEVPKESDITLEAHIGQPTVLPIERQLSKQEYPINPCVTFAQITIDGLPFLTVRQTYTHRTDPYTTEYWGEVTSHVEKINTAHPCTKKLLNAAKSLLINRAKRVSDLESAIADGKHIKPSHRKNSLKKIREIDKKVQAIKKFDAESILGWGGMRGMRFHADRLPPQFKAPPAEVFSMEVQDIETGELSRLETPDFREATNQLIAKAFELCLFALLDAFGNTLGFSRLRDSLRAFGATRSVPGASFSEKSRERDAPDWPQLSQSQARLANQWLKKLARPETRYELIVREKDTRSRGRDRAGSGARAEFIGIRDLSRKLLLPLSDVGAGFGQIAPILLSAFSDDSEVLLIEQPELHLHPAVQAELADLFIERSLGNESGETTKQFIIETHSEHLLLRLMRRIRESSTGQLPAGCPPVSADEIALLYVEPRGGESVVLEMPLDELGRLTRDWPGGFFEEGIREVLM